MAFGERANNNSVLTAKLYTLYNDTERTYERNTLVSKRAVVYYCNITAENTKKLYADSKQLETPEGWNGVMVTDTDGTCYLWLNNFATNDHKCTVIGKDITAEQVPGDSSTIYVYNKAKGRNTIMVTVSSDGDSHTENIKLSSKVLKISIHEGKLSTEKIKRNN
jgi:hypothetical protein